MPSLSLDTPVGRITVQAEGGALTRLGWGTAPGDPDPLTLEAARQIAAYFDGSLTGFDLPLRVTARPAQRAICAAIAAIPFGETRTYGELARDLGLPAQAVGQGCGGNPLPILIPCHRVLSATGLGGFSGGTGIETKIALLRHEGAAGLLL